MKELFDLGFVHITKDNFKEVVKPGGVFIRDMQGLAKEHFALKLHLTLSDYMVTSVEGYNYTTVGLNPDAKKSIHVMGEFLEGYYYPDSFEIKSKLPPFPKMYLVGGAVRDEIEGLEPNDLDYAIEAPSYDVMKFFVTHHLKAYVKVENPEYTTLKALYKNETCDFVLCRKDGLYKDGRHPESVEVGTIYDDLARRDFTINAMARDMATSEILDPFNGKEDLKNKLLRCVGNTEERMKEDSLRLLRAMRFSLTKNLYLDSELQWALENFSLVSKLENLKPDRIYQEYSKCYKNCRLDEIMHFHYTYQRFSLALFDVMRKKGISVMPTLKKI